MEQPFACSCLLKVACFVSLAELHVALYSDEYFFKTVNDKYSRRLILVAAIGICCDLWSLTRIYCCSIFIW